MANGEDILPLVCDNGTGMVKGKLAKVGPWGGDGGDSKDVQKTPSQLLRISVYANSQSVRGIFFSYTSCDGKTYNEGPWGSNDATENEILLKNGEYLKQISGEKGQIYGLNVVRSLKFVTNTKTYGPYGGGGDTPFDIPVQNNGSIEGFFGRSGDLLDAIGVYVEP